MNTDDVLRREAEQSLIWRTAASIAGAYEHAWPRSSTYRVMAGVVSRAPRDAAARLRYAASTVALVILGYMVITRTVLPGYVRSSLPWYVPALPVITAVVIATGAEAYARAWRESVIAGLLTRRASARRPAAR